MVLRLLEKNIEVVVWNRSPEPIKETVRSGAFTTVTLKELPSSLPKPAIIWLMLPSGKITDEAITELINELSPGDIVIDGGNSFYKDSIKRFQKLHRKKIHFVDAGVSGGPDGARSGACIMAGGEKNVFDALIPIFTALSAPNAYIYTGETGSGHFTKMIHNGIEYGMMQSIAEGAAILKASSFKLHLAQIFSLYNNRSVIESRLVGWAAEALNENPELTGITSIIAHTGEGKWTVDTAKKLNIQIPVIKQALVTRIKSPLELPSFRNKMISVLRAKFGKHDVKG